MHCHPILSKRAGECLVNAYKEMREQGLSSKTITFTPRQLESMIRISEAFAKMRLSSEVSVEDVNEARQLI